ncbi:hypothetical protein HN681_01980 [archaeon]|mgnify:CR=1 FL=1|jgi:hypothetical protein|nr:hypothetical protein [archaeon]MBT3731344.1 hypothetical protein [archaeon]MBT4670353.1 hypothetical protein [archaeon]MBT5029629.1 hypothetical protein [archaeon]MBT5287622.1 hypothetical protein [archaeon]
MLWQDLVITIANLLFTYSLAHQVYYGFKKKKGLLTLIASGLTFIGLYAIAIAFFTLNLYFSSVVATINATLWLTLFIQRIKYSRA